MSNYYIGKKAICKNCKIILWWDNNTKIKELNCPECNGKVKRFNTNYSINGTTRIRDLTEYTIIKKEKCNEV